MSMWTHTICLPCWNKRMDMRKPVEITQAPEEQCCYCQRMTMDGIYIRENPANVLCLGRTGVHETET